MKKNFTFQTWFEDISIPYFENSLEALNEKDVDILLNFEGIAIEILVGCCNGQNMF